MKDAKDDKSPEPKRKHPLLVGLSVGALVGFFAGWWFPPPPSINMPRVRARTRHGVSAAASSARQRAAQIAGAVAESLKETEMPSAKVHNPPMQAMEIISQDSPFPAADRTLEQLRYDDTQPRLTVWVLPVPGGE